MYKMFLCEPRKSPTVCAAMTSFICLKRPSKSRKKPFEKNIKSVARFYEKLANSDCFRNKSKGDSVKKHFGAWLDFGGAVVSWLCAVHCLVLPFAVSLLPMLGLGFLLDESTERIFIAISLFIAALTLLPGFLFHHRRIKTLFLFGAGFGLIVFSHAFFEEDFYLKASTLIISALLITSAHLINRRLCKKCALCNSLA